MSAFPMPKSPKQPIYLASSRGLEERRASLLLDIVDVMAPRFFRGSRIIRIGQKFQCELPRSFGLAKHMGADGAKLPDIIIHDRKRSWLVLVDACVDSPPIETERRLELIRGFRNPAAGLVFVSAFETRRSMQGFLGSISWESEVWIAEAPDHLIHFNGERFLGPYPDAMPTRPTSRESGKKAPLYNDQAYADAAHAYFVNEEHPNTE